ncbi:terminase family protein [Acidobacteriia bacterium AH_259_A11_L15]|nr:terminase family protein [Acidobacteriia bacterium AH_259_A11_L15]
MSKQGRKQSKPRRRAQRLRVHLLPYQQRWVEDDSRFKIACKARQIGFTFAAAYRVVCKRVAQPGLTLWLSASERQTLEAMEHVRHHISAAGAVAEYFEEPIEGMQLKQHTVRLDNGSRIVALPANPDTVRGFAGDVVLDEFGFHRDADAIWRAAFATATRGFQLEIISTPNGARGKYYELARAAGLVDWQEAKEKSSASSGSSIWSPHRVDLPTARAQGFVVDVESLRAAIGDEDAWQQEYCCRFLSDAAHYIPPELVVAAEHPAATTTPPFLPAAGATGLDKMFAPLAQREARSTGAVYLGVDIGRRRDLTVLWLLEVENPLAPPEARVYSTRGVLTLDRQPFSQQHRALDSLLAAKNIPLSPVAPAAGYLVQRCAVDATGLGAMLAEELEQKWGGRVEPVQFTLGVKEDLAVRVKRLLEDGRLRLPYDPAVRAALGSVKRYATATGHWRFDADRTDTAGHADHFWALALALYAAVEPELSVDYVSTAELRPSSQAFVF